VSGNTRINIEYQRKQKQSKFKYKYDWPLKLKMGSKKLAVKFAPTVKYKIPRRSWDDFLLVLPEIIFFAAVGFILSRAEVLGSILPFGPAFYAALACSDRRQAFFQALPIMGGLLTVLSGQAYLYNMGIIILLGIVFFFHSIDLDRQWTQVPAVVFSAVLVVKGLGLFWGHASEYQIISLLFEGAFAAGLSLVFLVVQRLILNRQAINRFSADEIVCIFVALIGLIMGMGSFSVAGIEIGAMISRLTVILAAFIGGGGAGAAMGTLVGVVPSLSSMIAPSIIGLYAFSGLLAGVFNGFGRLGVVMGFLLGNLLLALYLLDTSLIISSLTASAMAGLLFFLVPMAWLHKLGSIFHYSLAGKEQTPKEDYSQRLALNKLNSVSHVFHELAATMEQIAGEQDSSDDYNINSVLHRISARVCQDCTLQKLCWEKDFYQTYRSIVSLFTAIEKDGGVSIKDMPVGLRKRCSHAQEMLIAVNCLFELYQKNHYWQLHMENTRSLMANQLTGSAQIIDKVTKEIKNSGNSRYYLEAHLKKMLAGRGFFVERVSVMNIGENSLDLVLEVISCPGVDDCQRILLPALSRLVGKEYQIIQSNCSYDTGIKSCRFRMMDARAFRLNIAQYAIAKHEEDVCGDSTNVIFLPEGKQILMLSDGMGIGESAALESETSLHLLEKLLENGFDETSAIQTINSVLMFRAKEDTFATMDICIIDLFSGATDFIKIGAGPSFVKKKEGVNIIRASSLPIGILNHVEMETMKEVIRPGDVIVLASDGLLDTGHRLEDAERWIAGIIENSPERNPKRLAESLVKNAVNLGGGRPRDDISVIVAVVEDDVEDLEDY
jgi:stage II sporulation protein E